jgi:hypothetical protein
VEFIAPKNLTSKSVNYNDQDIVLACNSPMPFAPMRTSIMNDNKGKREGENNK